MTPATNKEELETPSEPQLREDFASPEEFEVARAQILARLRLLWTERRVLLRITGASLIIATLIAFLIPKRYESTAQLMPPDSQSSSSLALLAGLSAPGGLGILAGDLLGIKSTGALFVGVLRCRTVEDRIVDRFDLKRVYGQSLQMKAREKLAERTAITEDRKSGIITVTVTDNDPKRAAAIAGSYVEELNTLIAQLSTSSARRERIFLEDRLTAVKQDLEAAEKDFSQFASSKGAIDIPAQGKAMVEAAATLEGQLIAAQSELDGLKQIYTDENVRVRSTQARINGLRDEIRKLGGRATGASESADDPPGDAPYPTLRQLPILGVPFADKLRRMKVQEAVFETLTKQYELAKVQEAKEVPSVKVLDAPVIPEHKSFPPRLLIMILGMVCGALVGIVWIVGHARWQEIDPQDPGKALAQEVFQTFAARIPWISRNGAGQETPAAETNSEPERPEDSKSASAGS
jgi:capsule polysaccharide export protein KpsE/RkpR